MSLQRVFESARKLGVPLIVTDASGQEPMVVIPLEQFEALTEGAECQRAERSEFERPKMKSEAHSIPITTPLPHEMQEKIVPELKREMEKVSLDERFYLEPLDDEQTG